MSIFASLDAPDEDHEDNCAHWEKHGDTWEISGKACTCGLPKAPIIYKGSNVLPEMTDERGGYVDIALIPPHVRYWRENPNAPAHEEPDMGTHPPDPFLRFGVNEERVILDRNNVELIVNELQWWLTELKKYE